ncbi:MAG: hypothetical protein EXQ85_03575 [Alphaproteobacteria bacterium]|nr:hypothetical protein [Alphaproteobacteria bacterium]
MAKKTSGARKRPAFASPNQARWAGFLDTMGVSYTSAPEQHEFRGTPYRPDFLVADWNSWIEVIAEPPTKLEVFRCLELSRATERFVLLIVGEPASHGIILFDPSGYFRKEGSDGWQFGQGKHRDNEIWLVSEEGAFTLQSMGSDEEETFPLVGDEAPRIMQALLAAHEAAV